MCKGRRAMPWLNLRPDDDLDYITVVILQQVHYGVDSTGHLSAAANSGELHWHLCVLWLPVRTNIVH